MLQGKTDVKLLLSEYIKFARYKQKARIIAFSELSFHQIINFWYFLSLKFQII